MRYLSVCSGIEAATQAWHPLGWVPVAFSEIEKFPSAVLAHHYPHVANYGDMTKFQEWPDHAIDLLVGGTPCQSFSVAGLRRGLADPRGNLMLTYLAIAGRYRPRWLVWENVPGALSVDGGSAFGSLIGGMAELGYHAAWRVLDAQYVRVAGHLRAVPQRRKRVFVVGYLGDWRRAAAVFLEREGLSGNSPPRREAGQGTSIDVAPCLRAGGNATGGDRPYGTDVDTADSLLPVHVDDAARCVTAGYAQRLDWETENFVASREVAATLTRGAESAGKGGYAGRRQEDDINLVAHALRVEAFAASEDGTGRGTPLVPIAYNITPSNSNKDYNAREASYAQAVTTQGGAPSARGGDLVTYPINTQIATRHEALGEGTGMGIGSTDDPAFTLQAGHSHAVAAGWAVRRLTPTECERLQGFPDGFTNIPWRGKPEAPDGPRYKALGNSMAVNAMAWIGERIDRVEKLTAEKAAAA